MTVKQDTLDRFLFEEHSVRGELVRLESSFQQILASYHYPSIIQSLLGELMAAASLLTATLKFEGEVALQIQSDGPVRYAVINGTHDQKLRGVARWDESQTLPTDFTSLFSKGYLAITLAPSEGERYQGIVALDKPTLAECLEDYFLQSEQLLTKVALFSSHESGNEQAGGMLLQVVPETSETSQANENPGFEHLSHLMNTLKAEELFGLSAQEVLHRLYHEEAVRLFEPQQVQFSCDCSKERSASALRNVAKTELLSIIEEEGSIKMNCQFCHTEYSFDSIDVESIHSQNIPAENQQH
ncbi:Hsp33 family molecular chaperone HslO [Glaciecola sp. MH2013]|uniref:Hsp33 family molecular chaperone HslO n=1 Tax=Glaciecola sp. MH2013 TaxID=2785524 RepID=UPI00189DE49C|nr:Hsp33 family molecular chaperone HslO [Glaciecola sp. MH2013]MBF7074349.1 Hsp33 family molecular chaperone HslO [Glaciecola sp. MH2013]